MKDDSPSDGELQSEIDRLRSRVTQLETDRRGEARIENELRELETIYANAPVGLCFVGRDLRFRRVNSVMAEINGRSLADHLGARVDEIIPDIEAQVVPVYERILRTGEPVVDLEVRGTLPSDPSHEHVWNVNHHPVKSAAGDVVGIVTVVQDITAQKQAEFALREIQERLVEAQRVASLGSWEWNLVNDEVWWSDELYRLFGRDPRNFSPSFNAFMDAVHPEDRPVIRRQLDATFKKGEPYAVRYRAVLPDGRVRVIEARALLERDPSGLPLRLVGTAHDVTQQEGPSPTPADTD